MIDELLVKNILNKIKGARKILVLGHSNPRPDGDSLGSVLAMARFLKTLKKDYQVFSQYLPEERLRFLPGWEQLESNPEKIKIEGFDLIILLDFGQLKNSGLETKLRQALSAGVTFINFDHHPDNNEVSRLAVVMEGASSTSEIIFNFLTQIGAPISKDMATCLLTGILTDTQNYTNLATTFTSLQAGSELLRRGARLQEITSNTWKNKKLPTLRLWGKVLLRLEEDPATGIATTAITLKDLAEENLPLEAAEGVANFLNSLGQAKAVLVLREEAGGKVKGSLRTTRDDVDVSKFAKQFGGGGHKKAAGFVVPGHLVKTEKGWKIVE